MSDDLALKFDLLQKQLSQLQTTYLQFAIWTVGALLVAIGWIMTSEKAREFLTKNRPRLVAMPTIAVTWVLDTVSLVWAHFQSMSLVVAIDHLNYVESEYYQRYGVGLSLLWIYLIVHTVLFIALFLLVLWPAESQVTRTDNTDPRTDSAPSRTRLTMTVAVGLGFVEAWADLFAGGMQWRGLPLWAAFLVVVVLAAVVITLTSLLTARAGGLWQFAAGAAAGVLIELTNQLALAWWQWSPATYGCLPRPWVISVVLGGYAGLGPLVTNYIVSIIVRRRASVQATSQPPPLPV